VVVLARHNVLLFESNVPLATGSIQLYLDIIVFLYILEKDYESLLLIFMKGAPTNLMIFHVRPYFSKVQQHFPA